MKIYLAGPYSHPDPDVSQMRFLALNEMAAKIIKEGHIVFSPISHSHPIAVQCELPKGFEFWSAWNKSFIDWCDEVWIADLPGRHESVGLAAEIKYARSMGKPVKQLAGTGVL